MTRDQKIERARELRAEGKTLREIAAEVGISTTTALRWTDPDQHEKHLAESRARKELYRGTCEDCGAPTNGSRGPGKAFRRCSSCHRKREHESRYWTQQRIVEAIRRFAAQHGRPPHAADFTPATARRLGHEHRIVEGRWPGTWIVKREFGSWNAAIEAAGFRPFDHARDHDWGFGRPSKRLAA